MSLTNSNKMLPANISYPEEERTMDNFYVPRLSTIASNYVPSHHVSMDTIMEPFSESSPSTSMDPLGSSPNMQVNLTVEVQSRKRSLSYGNDAENKRYCRRDSESGISSEDMSTSPEAAICFLFQSPPSVISPYNYPRDYSFCDRSRKQNKPLDLTKDLNNTGDIIGKKLCLNSVNKDVYLEPKCPEMNSEDNEEFCVPLNLSDANDDEDGENIEVEDYQSIELENQTTHHEVYTSVQFNASPSPKVPDNDVVQVLNPIILENVQENVEVSDLASQCLQEFFQNWNETGSQELQEALLYTDYVSGTPAIALEPALESSPQEENTEQGVIQPENTEQGVMQPENTEQGVIQPENTEQGVMQPEYTEQGVIQPENTEQGVIQPESTEQGVIQPENTEQGVIQPENTEQGVIQPENTEQGVIQPENTEQGVTQPENTEQGMTQPENTEQGVIQPENTEQGVMQPENTEQGASQPENTEADMPVESSDLTQNTEETSRNSYRPCHLPSMPLLGDEPELAPIVEEEEPDEQQTDPAPNEIPQEEETIPSIPEIEPPNEEMNSQNTEISTEDTQTASQNSTESTKSEDINSEIGMLDILMKPTLPQNSTLTYSRLFTSAEDEFLSRPSVSPQPCMPVLIARSPSTKTPTRCVTRRRCHTPVPTTPSRIQPKRRASMGSVRSYSPSLDSNPSSPLMPILQPNLTPTTKSSSLLSIPKLDYEGSSPLGPDMESEESAPICSYSPILAHPSLASSSAKSPSTPRRRGRAMARDLCQQAVSPAIARVQLLASPTKLRSRSQSPAGKDVKSKSPAARGRSQSPAGRGKVKKVSQIKASLEKKAEALSSQELAVMREREKMLSHDRWMEQRRLLYSRFIPEVKPPDPHIVDPNMQPKVILERNIGLDARAISEAQLLKLQAAS